MLGIRLQLRVGGVCHQRRSHACAATDAAAGIYEQLKQVKSSEQMMEEVLERVRKTTAEEVRCCDLLLRPPAHSPLPSAMH
jgi:hypothetical protein